MSSIGKLELVTNKRELESVTNNIYGIPPAIWPVLKNTIYPGAKDESIANAWDYCVAANLNILQKPVHIVLTPVNIGNGNYEYREIVMPGIGLYRIQAARSGQYVGLTAPEFSGEVECNLGGEPIIYPEWCSITVKRAVGNFIAEFTAVERWIENYAIAKKGVLTPNRMWKKRPFGQLAKVAEAQALRKGFQEFVDQQPTAEEMEGKFIDESDIQNLTLKTDSLNSKLDSMLLKQEEKENTDNITIDKHSELQKLIENNRIPLETVSKWCEKAGVERLNELDKEKVLACINYAEKYGHREAV